MLAASLAGISRADNPSDVVREGLRWYGKANLRRRGTNSRRPVSNSTVRDSAKAAIAAFDQACASHRKGDVAQAREWYLKAGLAHDKGWRPRPISIWERWRRKKPRRMAGEVPENVAPDKRQEILDQLKAAVASFRHCLDLQPDNAHARRDIELVRQWIKYYADRWHARDREARRRKQTW